MLDKVSVVIPTLNSAETINKCLVSIEANNSRYDHEIIVIDGGSKDGTVEIAGEHAHKILTEDTYFRGVNRNKGIKNSQGNIICFTDSDCVVPENWIDKLVDGLLRLNVRDDKIVGVGGGNIPWIENPPSLMELAITRVMRSPLVAFGARNVTIYKDERQVYHNPPVNSAYFRWTIEEVGGFGEEYNVGEDVELDIKLTEKGYKLYYLPDVLVYHQHRSTFKKFIRQMYDFGKTRIRLARKFQKYSRLSRFGRLYHYGPLLLCLMTLSPFLFIPLGMALVNSTYICLKHRTGLIFFPAMLLTMSFYVSYGAGEIAHLLGKK